MIYLFGNQLHIPLSHLAFVLLRIYIFIQILSTHSSHVNSTSLTANTIDNNTTLALGLYTDSVNKSIENKTNLYTTAKLFENKTNPVHTLSHENKFSNVTIHLGEESHSGIHARQNRSTYLQRRNQTLYYKRYKRNNSQTTTESIPYNTNSTTKHTITYNTTTELHKTTENIPYNSQTSTEHTIPYNANTTESIPNATNSGRREVATSGLQRITKSKPKSQKTKSRPSLPSSRNNSYMAFKSRGSKRKKTISILGLFELTDANKQLRLEGFSELEAAKLAVEHVNKANMLYDYQMELHTNDTKVRFS